MDSSFFKIGDAFKAITRSVFPDRTFSGSRNELAEGELAKKTFRSKITIPEKANALNGSLLLALC